MMSEHDHEILAKLDNLDRTVGELGHQVETLHVIVERGNAEKAWLRGALESQLQAQADARVQAREDARERTSLWVQGAQAIWRAGGSWIVLGVVVGILAMASRCSGVPVRDIIGIGPPAPAGEVSHPPEP